MHRSRSSLLWRRFFAEPSSISEVVLKSNILSLLETEGWRHMWRGGGRPGYAGMVASFGGVG